MKIGVLTAHISRRSGGFFHSVHRLSRSLLKDQALDLKVFGLRDPTYPGDSCVWGDLPLTIVQSLGPQAFAFAPSLQRLLRQADLSVLHAQGLWMYPSMASLHWARTCRRPYLISPRGMLDPWAVRHAAWKKRLVAWWFEDAHLAGATCLHALNQAEARAIRTFGLHNPICVVPNGMDPPPAERPGVPAWADKLRGGTRVLLFLGRLHPKKGLANLIHAWAAVQRDGAAREWTFVVAGWDQGGHGEELKSLTADAGVGGTVRFVGPQFGDDRAGSLALADAFVLPSFSEGLPVAVLEAWSYGLPVLMTEACNLPEGFSAGAALPIEPHPVGIEEGLRRLFAMSDVERWGMGQRGRLLVREQFTWPRIAGEMKRVYEWVLGGGAPPACVMTD